MKNNFINRYIYNFVNHTFYFRNAKIGKIKKYIFIKLF